MSDKGQSVIQKLQDGWTSVPDLLQQTGWQAHTLRAVISTEAKKRNLKIERRREEGVTSYRVAQ